MYINGSQQSTRTTNSTGYALFTYNFTSKGLYNVTFVSATTSVYDSATSYDPLIVFLTPPSRSKQARSSSTSRTR